MMPTKTALGILFVSLNDSPLLFMYIMVPITSTKGVFVTGENAHYGVVVWQDFSICTSIEIPSNHQIIKAAAHICFVAVPLRI